MREERSFDGTVGEQLGRRGQLSHQRVGGRLERALQGCERRAARPRRADARVREGEPVRGTGSGGRRWLPARAAVVETVSTAMASEQQPNQTARSEPTG